MARRFTFIAALGVLLLASAAHADPCIDAAEGQHELKTANKLVAAKKQLQVCAQASCGEKVAAACTKWLAEVEASLPTVVVQALAADGTETTRVRVTLDGEAVASALDGTALAVNPGSHHFRFDREGGGSVDQDVVIRIGEKNRKILVKFPAAPGPPLSAAPASPPPESAPPRRAPALVAFALGAAGLGVGTATGIIALDQKAQLDRACPTKKNCPERELGTRNAAEVNSIVSTVAVPLGGIGVGVGVLFWVLSSKKPEPKTTQAHVSLSFYPSRLGIQGAF